MINVDVLEEGFIVTQAGHVLYVGVSLDSVQRFLEYLNDAFYMED